ncbi:MAG: NADPH-dependent F420 reductase [SAR324 cluster bacterium]
MIADTNRNHGPGRILRGLGAIALGTALCALPRVPMADTPTQPKPLQIGIIGAGKIGGTLGELWVKAGHEVLLSSRHPEELKPLADRLGPLAHTGTVREAAAFGEVVLIAVPYGAMPQVGRDFAGELKGKIVLDTGNPVARRDGPMADVARSKGTGVASAEFLPGVRLVRAFNSFSYMTMRSEAHRAGEQIGIPLAGDDRDALEVAARLVRDAGFEPVVAGPLARAKEFDLGMPCAGAMTARELKQCLHLAP